MAKNSNHEGTTFSLSVENRNLDGIIFHPTKPVSDSELNGIFDFQSAKLQDAIRSEVPSGWLDAIYSVGDDNSYSTYGVNTTSLSGIDTCPIYLNSLKNNTFLAIVNGWVIPVGGTGVNNDSLIRLDLPEAPSSGSRSDLVFLEVWKASLKANSTINKPSINQIYKYGNTDYAGTNLSDEIVNTSIGFETTSRVQIQYRIRIVSGVNFSVYPEGLNDFNTVYAQGGYTTPRNAYPFINAGTTLDDYGLYIAGDGSPTSVVDLESVDGYVYAIPMFRIHRRNTSGYDTTNQNGSNISVLSGDLSDRPDGLYYDKVDKLDIEDLRHKVTFGSFNHAELLEKNLDNLLSGEMNTMLTKSSLDSNLERTNLGFYINTISLGTFGNVHRITQPNGQQRYYGDVPKTIKATEKRTIANKTLGNPALPWTSTDEVQVGIMSPIPMGGAIIGLNTPVVYFSQTTFGPITLVPNGSWSNLGAGVSTFTLGNISGLGLTTQDLFITYEISYLQKGDKLTKPVKEILKVKNVSNNEDWGFISVTDLDTTVVEFQKRKERKITLRTTNNTFKDTSFVYRVSDDNPPTKDTFYGIGTLYSYYMDGNGTQTYVIPGNLINTQDASYIVAAFDTYAGQYLNMVPPTRNPTNYSLTANLPYIITSGKTIRFDIALLGGVLEYDERIQTVNDMGSVNFYEIMGNNTDTIVLKNCLNGKDPSDIIIGTQKENYLGVYSTCCYVDNQRRFCTVTYVENTSLVQIYFPTGAVPSTSKITISLYTKKTLTTSDNLQISYNYKEYKGISKKNNFGTGANSYINSKIMYHDNKLRIITNGTGAINTSEFLPKKYEPLIPVLPIPDYPSCYTGNFTGTLNTSKVISGGSYTVPSIYNAPYSCGKENYFTKNGVSNDQGSYKGGYFTTSCEDGGSVNKIVMAPLVEMVLKDGSGNFLPGELGLKVETNYISSSTINRITNSDCGETLNTFDMFKLEGKPLYKVKNK